jgi:hypothetical protein
VWLQAVARIHDHARRTRERLEQLYHGSTVELVIGVVDIGK